MTGIISYVRCKECSKQVKREDFAFRHSAARWQVCSVPTCCEPGYSVFVTTPSVIDAWRISMVNRGYDLVPWLDGFG